MADAKKAGVGIAGITEEAKAILAEIHDDAVKIGGEVLTLAADVRTTVVETGQEAAAALSSLIETIWAAARSKFGKAALLLALLFGCAGPARAQCPCTDAGTCTCVKGYCQCANCKTPAVAAKADCLCTGPGNCSCAAGTCACPNCVVHAAVKMTAKCAGCTCVPGYLPCPACERLAARKALDGKQIVYQGHRWTWSFAADDWIDSDPAPVYQPVSQPLLMRQAFTGGGCSS